MSKSILNQWVKEFNAPVIITVTTPEAERLCLKNGLLFHEMLSAFGHLDGINGVIRAGNQTFPIADAHIRFERNTECKAKSFPVIEKRLREVFEAYDISKLPNSSLELKSSPPTAWNHQTEQLVTRLLSFSEYEMTSHPHLILTVVATSDVDPINAMHELVSSHQYTPSNLISTGQYDASIVQRLYILLHDNADQSTNPITILKQLQTKFNSSYTKLLPINSFPTETPNFQQPDVWSRFMVPTYYPDELPHLCTIEQSKNKSVLGCYLSIEDFMSIRNFCVELYNQWIMPSIERRVIALNKNVNETRKGMRNVLKSFWRKPRDETETIKGIVKYKYDKIESQILFLADTSFMLKDLENALSMYKLVRDDFKADKSILHVAHAYLMIAACHMLLDPSHPKELFSDLEALAQVLLTNQENPFLNAYFAFLAAEMYVLNPSTRAPMEASKILLQAASSIGGNSILSALLTEKAARYLLQTHQVRKYVFYTVLSGNIFLKCSSNAKRHAAVCFASVMLVIDKTNWIDLKGKLCHILSQDAKLNNDKISAQRALLLMLKMLNFSLCDDDNDVIGTAFTSIQLINQSLLGLHEIIGVSPSNGFWGNISIQSSWEKLTIRQILLESLPITSLDCISNSNSDKNINDLSYVEINNLSIPEIDISSTRFLHSIKGIETTNGSILIKNTEQSLAEEMYIYLNLENQWLEEQQTKNISKNHSFNSIDTIIIDSTTTSNNSNTTTTTTTPQYNNNNNNNNNISQMNDEVTLADIWVEKEKELLRSRDSTKPINHLSLEDTLLRIPLGEEIKIKIKLSNKLCEDLQLNELKMIIEPENNFHSNEMNILMQQNSFQEVILTSKPLQYGQYKVNQLSWKLSNNFKVKQSLQKPGPLLQNTRQQRARGERGEDHSLSFIVVPPHPLLRITFEGLSAEVLQGQLLKSTLVLYNDGAATACDIIIKLSQPSFVFYVYDLIDTTTTEYNRRNSFKEELITSCGGSCTLMRLAPTTKILPGQSLRLEAWLMLNTCGIQKVSLLASYKALRDNGKKEVFGPGNLCRTSFVSIKTKVLPSLAISCKLLSKTSSIENFTIMTDILNHLRNQSDSDVDNDGLGDNKRERLSSVGQLDLSDLVNTSSDSNSYNDIDENYFKIMGLWLLGAGIPFQYKQLPQKQQLNKSTNIDVLISPSTNVTKCFPIKLAIPSSTSSSALKIVDSNINPIEMNNNGKCSWLLPIPDMSATDIHLVRIIEQFLCISYSSTSFFKEIENSRLLSQAAELEAETLGPRSITQVRREKQTQLLLNNTNKSQPSCILSRKNPKNIDDLANIFAKDFKILLASIWICKWEGKLRWGLHQDNTISFVHKTALPSHNLINNNLSLKTNAADYLLVSLQHNNHTILDNTINTCCITVPVVLKLRSICIEYLSVTITAIDIDHRNNNDNSSIALASHDLSPSTHTTNIITNNNHINNANNNNSNINKITNNGCIWDGKTQYIGIILPSNSEKEIIINALITKPGLYNLNKFKVSVRFTNHENIQSTMKNILGQSLIEVINK